MNWFSRIQTRTEPRNLRRSRARFYYILTTTRRSRRSFAATFATGISTDTFRCSDIWRCTVAKSRSSATSVWRSFHSRSIWTGIRRKFTSSVRFSLGRFCDVSFCISTAFVFSLFSNVFASFVTCCCIILWRFGASVNAVNLCRFAASFWRQLVLVLLIGLVVLVKAFIVGFVKIFDRRTQCTLRVVN